MHWPLHRFHNHILFIPPKLGNVYDKDQHHNNNNNNNVVEKRLLVVKMLIRIDIHP
jgi:hypothetical protein